MKVKRYYLKYDWLDKDVTLGEEYHKRLYKSLESWVFALNMLKYSVKVGTTKNILYWSNSVNKWSKIYHDNIELCNEIDRTR